MAQFVSQKYLGQSMEHMFLETIFTGILFVESFWLLLKWHYSPHKTFKAELVVDGKNEFGNDAIKSIHVTWQCKTSWILMRTMKLLQGKNAHLDFGKSFNVAIVVNGQLFLLSDQYLMSIEKGFSPLNPYLMDSISVIICLFKLQRPSAAFKEIKTYFEWISRGATKCGNVWFIAENTVEHMENVVNTNLISQWECWMSKGSIVKKSSRWVALSVLLLFRRVGKFFKYNIY